MEPQYFTQSSTDIIDLVRVFQPFGVVGVVFTI